MLNYAQIHVQMHRLFQPRKPQSGIIYKLFLSVQSVLEEPLGKKRGEVQSFCPLNSAAKRVTGADSIWAIGICQLATALSLPDHFTQVTSHPVLTTSDHTILSKI